VPRTHPASSGPAALATWIALVYVLSCGLYIWLSTTLAAQAVADVLDLRRIELAKGLAFVAVTGLGFWGVVYALLRRNVRQAGIIAGQQRSLDLAQRRAVVGLAAASVAHDVNNVLTVMRVAVDAAAVADDPAVRGEALARLEDATRQLAGMARRLQRLGQGRLESERKPQDLSDVGRSAVRLLEPHARARGCALRARIAPGVWVVGSRPLLDEMILNLLLNAVAAARADGRVEMRVAPEADGGALLEVHDDGPGIPAELRDSLFEAYRRGGAADPPPSEAEDSDASDPDGQGLGLFSVRLCAERHGARAEVDDSPLGGACLRVRFPAPEARAGALPQPSAGKPRTTM